MALIDATWPKVLSGYGRLLLRLNADMNHSYSVFCTLVFLTSSLAFGTFLTEIVPCLLFKNNFYSYYCLIVVRVLLMLCFNSLAVLIVALTEARFHFLKELFTLLFHFSGSFYIFFYIWSELSFPQGEEQTPCLLSPTCCQPAATGPLSSSFSCEYFMSVICELNMEQMWLDLTFIHIDWWDRRNLRAD